jgi:gas vesicle protein
MSQRDGFGSGFLAGAIFGGVVGGVIGALVASQRNGELAEADESQFNGTSLEGKKNSAKRRSVRSKEADSMEMETARRSLEDKIAHLNATIDEVRQQLGTVNSGSSAKSGD